MTPDLEAIDRTLSTLTERLIGLRTASGHWEGCLASSALSTATATIALRLHGRASKADHRAHVRSGVCWLIANQNRDGGWGDTVLSASNLSTTALCWAALHMEVSDPSHAPAHDLQRVQDAIAGAERWLRAKVGDLQPGRLQHAIVARYGRDRTFSAPILTVLAVAGMLGPGPEAWRRVPQLPFELAACPHEWFRWLRLPVVSYAVPALVAIGQARHHHAPTRNPALRAIRSMLAARTRRLARQMQPASGGYLEAVPLTAFVVMNLVAAGFADDATVQNGAGFLARSVRADGSWPIDTNLATWVTTWAVGALGDGGGLAAEGRSRIVQWLLGQQVAAEHPFTHAMPGGWAWTDLSGGVPDADDTSGALRALWRLAGSTHLRSATAGIEWLLDLQNTDGGVPTFCRGWGALPFDRSAPDLTAHALEAWDDWYPAVPAALQRRIVAAARRAVAYLAKCQRPDGSWVPLWFGNERAADEINPTYGTARVVPALANSLSAGAGGVEQVRRRGVGWLVRAQHRDGGWSGDLAGEPSIEETGLALDALVSGGEATPALTDAIARGAAWLVSHTEEGRRSPAAPIGLYFARLWYFEELYPLVFGLKGLTAARAAIAGRNGARPRQAS
jgi:squalene-hopene/tetraprenyl-beta-curcumene cyclase